MGIPADSDEATHVAEPVHRRNADHKEVAMRMKENDSPETATINPTEAPKEGPPAEPPDAKKASNTSPTPSVTSKPDHPEELGNPGNELSKQTVTVRGALVNTNLWIAVICSLVRAVVLYVFINVIGLRLDHQDKQNIGTASDNITTALIVRVKRRKK